MIHKPKLSIKDNILITLKNARVPVSAYHILVALEELGYDNTNESSIVVTLSQMKKENLVDFDKIHCHCCGHATGHYRLTDDGRIKCRDIGPAITTIKQFAELDEVG